MNAQEVADDVRNAMEKERFADLLGFPSLTDAEAVIMSCVESLENQGVHTLAACAMTADRLDVSDQAVRNIVVKVRA